MTELRPGVAAVASRNGALSIQVRLGAYAPERFAERLRDPQRRFVLAEYDRHLLGFAENLPARARYPRRTD